MMQGEKLNLELVLTWILLASAGAHSENLNLIALFAAELLEGVHLS